MKNQFFSALLFALALLFCSPAHGSCSASRTFEISETQLTELENHLSTLEANNEELLNLLNESESELTTALNQLRESKNQIAQLKTQLLALKKESEAARKSLAIANEELANAAKSFKIYEKERDKIENRLRTQRNLWEAVAAVLAGVCIVR